MVSYYVESLWAMKINVEMFYWIDYCEVLNFWGRVIWFMSVEVTAIVGHDFLVAMAISLHKYSSITNLASICFQNEVTIRIINCEHWTWGENSLEFFKSCLLSITPYERCVFRVSSARGAAISEKFGNNNMEKCRAHRKRLIMSIANCIMLNIYCVLKRSMCKLLRCELEKFTSFSKILDSLWMKFWCRNLSQMVGLSEYIILNNYHINE